MPAQRTGTMKRLERQRATVAAHELNRCIDRFYYEDYPIDENERRYVELQRAQTAFNANALAYFIGRRQSSVQARLKRRAARRAAETAARSVA